MSKFADDRCHINSFSLLSVINIQDGRKQSQDFTEITLYKRCLNFKFLN
jgi:hypothetical protein